MKKTRKKKGFRYRIKNRQFQKLFFKNWIQVFLCIVLPLVACIWLIQKFSMDSLLKEVDAAALRSTSNTTSTLNALFEEVFVNLRKKVADENFVRFFQMDRYEPQRYSYISVVNDIISEINADYRENLYYSVDVYSQRGGYVISSPHKGQSYERFSDKSLVETFFECLDKKGEQILFAEPRTVTDKEQMTKKVITFYWAKNMGKDNRAFVAVSMDTEKLIHYIMSNSSGLKETYLILDSDNRVILDTSGKWKHEYMELPRETDRSSLSIESDGQIIRAFQVPMNTFGWRCVQLVPMEELEQGNIRLQRLVICIFALGLIMAFIMSYRTTERLFRPVQAILNLLENPSEQVQIGDEAGEIRYILLSVLEVFQKNMTLEQEMLERVVALRSARAKALQEQMTPHFLNNVLQAINWNAIAETGSENSITSKSILLLADILNTAKEQKNNITNIKDEIQYTKKFVELECLRYGPDIHCFFEAAEEVQMLPIPCISLQTLVENAISHGLQPKNGRGNIYVRIRVDEQKGLHIIVEDDGVGMEQEVIERLQALLTKEYIYVGEHLGLINLFQRFKLIYGEKCEFILKKSSYGGAYVEIITPELPEMWIQFNEK